jgi:hypothetical protein
MNRPPGNGVSVIGLLQSVRPADHLSNSPAGRLDLDQAFLVPPKPSDGELSSDSMTDQLLRNEGS